MHRLVRIALAIIAVAGATSCGRHPDGVLQMAIVGRPQAAGERGVHLSPAGQMLRSATVEGLVGFDAQGRVVPAIAERWIVTDDGESYIFRLRDGTWPDGSPITAESAAASLRRTLAALDGTSLGLDLSQIDQVRVMAGRVIEIDLASPMPDLLTLLAQPELGLYWKGQGAGPLAMTRDGAEVTLVPIPPEKRGLSPDASFAKRTRDLHVELTSASKAVDRFNDGYVDAVLGGDIDSLPLAGLGGLSRGNVRLDPVMGLFGLLVESKAGFLANPANREALAMAIDRDGLIGAFNVGGWSPTTRVVSSDVVDDFGTIGERWTNLSLAQRRTVAAARVKAWTSAGKPAPVLRLSLPDGPGSKIVFDRLSADFAAIGVTLKRVGEDEPAELHLLDRVARYARATWFLDQLSCNAGRVVCSVDGDSRLAEARAAQDPQQRAALLAEAEAAITATNGYIPIARPLRWSLVRSSVGGFALNPWGWHPLPPFAIDSK